MLVEVGNKLVALDVLQEAFVCDLNACKGACCVEGDSGAPLTMEEVHLLEEHQEALKPYMEQKGIEVVERDGVFYMDMENEPVTALVDGKECAFVRFDEKGGTHCGIEEAHRDGKIPFKKPISCHLYPIRSKRLKEFEALNYDRWSICSAACALGEKLQVKVFEFLKEPLIRKYGEDFYLELEEIAQELERNNQG